MFASWRGILVSGLLGAGGLIAAARGEDAGRSAVEADWLRQRQVAALPSADQMAAVAAELERGQLVIEDLRNLGAETAAATAERELAAIAVKCDALTAADTPAGMAWRQLYLDARWVIRRLAFANPRLDFDELLFVKRQWPRHGHQCSHRVGEAQTPGANLCILKGLHPDGQVRELLSGDFAEGGIGRPDLSWDGTRIVFPYAAPRRSGNRNYFVGQMERAGLCHTYDIYELPVAGGTPRQLTATADVEDTEPCYLPDGRIAFTSSRAGCLVQCGDWALVCGLYSMKADGSEVRRLTEPKEGEFYPSVLDDGRILYTRWDYLMKAYNVIQQLWAVNPDGTRAQLAYGDHFSFSQGPLTFFEARQIPGTSKVIATGAAHHNSGVGPIVTVDLDRNRGGSQSLQNLTPELGYPELNQKMLNETGEGAAMNVSATRSDRGWYAAPYPLSERHYLVCYSFDPAHNAAAGYGLYLKDVHGSMELIYRLEGSSCYAPMPVRARPRPPILPDTVDPSRATGTLIVHNVYQGLSDIPSGTVKYLQVLETRVKTVHTVPRRVDVGVNSGWDMRNVLGIVPVESDGSAHFEVPADRQIFLEALDGDFLEVRRMRNFMSVKPGEQVSCIGCHETYGTTPPQRRQPLLAMMRPASVIEPPPWGAERLGFRQVVQPVLDARCTACHDGSNGPEKGFDLRGLAMVEAPAGNDHDEGPQHHVSDSFMALLPFINYIRVGSYQAEKLPLSTRATGSGASRLMQVLKAGHFNVKLTVAEWRALAAWIDCNAPFYGDWDEVVSGTTAKRTNPTVLRALTDDDLRRQAVRRQQLQAGLNGRRLLAYLDCGPVLDTGDGEVRIRQTRGTGWQFCDAGKVPELISTQADITFDDQQLEFQLTGLLSGRAYKLSVSWWDYDANGRRQSIWAETAEGERVCLQAPVALPAYKREGHLPATLTLPLPPQSGTLKVIIRREGGSNAVAGEIWVSSEEK